MPITSITISTPTNIDIQLSTEESNPTHRYLLASFSGSSEEITNAAKATFWIDSPLISEILKTAKNIFPNCKKLIFDGSKTPFTLLQPIVEDPRMARDTWFITCNLEKIDEHGQLIEN